MKAKFISIYLCIVLLLVVSVSGTMAYFTDTTEAATNTIVAGNLDVALHYSLDEGATWQPLTKDDDVLVYMPGVPRTVMIKIANEGSLALKYRMETLVQRNIKGENDAGEEIDLSKYLQVHVADPTGKNPDVSKPVGEELMEGTLAPDAYAVVELTVLLPVTVGNEANYRVSTDPNNPDMYRPFIDLGLFVAATQASAESDSFGSDYDQNATIPTR